jgi:hypothetical protein
MSITSETVGCVSWSSSDEESSPIKKDVENDNDIMNSNYAGKTFAESKILPKFHNGKLPLQSEATGWLKYLLPFVIGNIITLLAVTEMGTRLMIQNNVSSFVELYVQNLRTDPIIIAIHCIVVFMAVLRGAFIDGMTFYFLLLGKRRRILPPNDKRLTHAVIVTQYKEVRRF